MGPPNLHKQGETLREFGPQWLYELKMKSFGTIQKTHWLLETRPLAMILFTLCKLQISQNRPIPFARVQLEGDT